MELNGHYIVHGANLEELRLSIPAPEARSTIVPPYPALQCQMLGVGRRRLDWIIVGLGLMAVAWAFWRYGIVPALRRRRLRREAEAALRRLHLRS